MPKPSRYTHEDACEDTMRSLTHSIDYNRQAQDRLKDQHSNEAYEAIGKLAAENRIFEQIRRDIFLAVRRVNP